MSAFTLTEGQQNALDKFIQFLTDPIEDVFVLKGYSGTGKTTLVKTIIDRLPNIMKAAQLVNPAQPKYELELTATTNKAAENFSHITGMSVSTIHSFLGLRVQTDYKNNETKLIASKKDKFSGYLLFIDEASYIDSQLLDLIFKQTYNCKIVFMGDPAQLAPVKSSRTPVFDAGFTGAELTQVVRQAEGNPIEELSSKFRETVQTGKFFSFIPDGIHVRHMSRDDYDNEIVKEFTRPDWKYRDSKILAWTNKRVISYNHAVSERVKGDPNFQEGDYAICNNFVTANRKSLKTDQLVCITKIGPDTDEYGVEGNLMELDYAYSFFFPKSLQAKRDLIKEARAKNMFNLVQRAESEWIDLRAAFACTVNKSQGSTYDRAFIDLDDISRCNNADTLARMLYVAVSRAKHQVTLTGDLI